MPSSQFLFQAVKHASDLLADPSIQRRPFHNFAHTLHVVSKSNELASHYNLSTPEREALNLAAWFHDTGYLYDAVDHEKQSVKIVSGFLGKFDKTNEFANEVNGLILATKFPAKPTSLIQEILCDADLHHLAADDYIVWSNKLRDEFQVQDGRVISERMWIDENISFFKAHHFFTEYANKFWESGKQRNLEMLVRLASH